MSGPCSPSNERSAWAALMADGELVEREIEAFWRSVREQGLGGRTGFGERPALLVVDMSCGFTDERSPLGADVSPAVAEIDAAARGGAHGGRPDRLLHRLVRCRPRRGRCLAAQDPRSACARRGDALGRDRPASGAAAGRDPARQEVRVVLLRDAARRAAHRQGRGHDRRHRRDDERLRSRDRRRRVLSRFPRDRAAPGGRRPLGPGATR